MVSSRRCVVAAGTRARWVTFDCYGTLVDWSRRGWATMLAPMAGDKRARHGTGVRGCQLALERESQDRSHKQVLKTALGAGGGRARRPAVGFRCAVDHGLVERAAAVCRRRGDAGGAARARLSPWRAHERDDDLFEITHRSFATPFDLFVTAERVRGYKPEPWLFRAFERMTGVEPASGCTSASNWYHDIAPAQALGVPRVWLDRGGSHRSGAASRATSAAEAVRAIDALGRMN